MDDLIATLSGGMHVSQESYDLESFKASLARTLVVPVSPSASSGTGGSLPRTRPASMHIPFTMDGLYAQPPPSPSSQCSQLSQFPFEEAASPASSPPAYSYEYDMDDDAALNAAFAGDAFAPMWEQPAAPVAADPWGAFNAEKHAAAWGSVPTQSVSVSLPEANQFALHHHQQQQLQYQQYHHQQQQYYEDEGMDEDAAEAVLDEEEALNGGYVRAW
ncbi:uncharacterized protein EHS24_007744 [Apiotrichum porosum]|uniref:Uncharacterized protein n=1 Tax=Apiotrichum porosum TaxID=105984 RepID=A0A427XV94_9TREE|nr:uncharacterized protein EHS24_007744 [Apiotrichum porosum]RSH82750.1 hypothetical protein EHS24_007744 [Apiotrichum porosum]